MSRSGFETSLKKTLKRLVKKIGYEISRLPYKVFLEREYIPDFTLEKKSGGFMYLEAKGVFTLEDRKKMLLVKEQHPDKDIRLLFQKNNYVTKLTKTQKESLKKARQINKMRYSDWADKHGFPWAIAEYNKELDEWSLPKKWIQELKTNTK